MTPEEYLDFVISVATPVAEARHRASRHREDIQSWLKYDLDVFCIFETGSWSHGTAASPWSDVDYFASMPGLRRSGTTAVVACFSVPISGGANHPARRATPIR